MTATLPEQLRTFHITAQGLDDAIPALNFDLVAAGRAIPIESASYPIRLPHGPVVPFTADAAAILPAAALLTERGPAHAAFLDRLRHTADRLADLLALDDSHSADAISPSSVHTALGAAAGQFLNMASLAGALRRRANPVHRMAPDRRDRCLRTLATLRQAVSNTAAQPPLRVFHTHAVPNPLHAELHSAADPCATALIHTLAELAAHETVLRALRVARLELEEAYVPETHDAILARFRWQAAEPAELAALPPALVFLTAAQAATLPVASFSRLLRSGAPILIVVAEPALSPEALLTESPDFAQLALALRDPFVLQGSLAFPDHLTPALHRAVAHTGPALACIATPAGGGWAESAILALAKAWPLFTYSPGAASFRDCFRLHPVEANTWTAAHAAALNPDLRSHFRTLPEIEGDHDPVELDKFLAGFHTRAPLAVPYITTADNARIAVSRDLAAWCHDRLAARAILDQWTAAPAPAPTAAPISQNDKEEAMRQGAEAAIAQVLHLLGRR
jgi:hypothetical protein